MTTSRIAFLLSGSGSTLRNLIGHIERGTVAGEVVVVISDRPRVGGFDIAGEHGIPTALVSRKKHRGAAAYSSALGEVLRPHDADLVVSGGFLTIYDVPPGFEGRMINVHPSLLPAFGGKGMWGHHVHEAVLARGCRVSGCTVHYVNDDVDGGPIIEQVPVPVRANDTAEALAARVQEAEREIYPRVIAEILAGAIRWEDGKVVRDA